MQIESIAIKNYRLFRDTKLENIPGLCSSAPTAPASRPCSMCFLKDALSMNVAKALAKRGDTARWCRGCADEPIEITLIPAGNHRP